MTKVLTILGTRPEIIRLSRIIPKLDLLVDHKVLHTGQNFDPNLSDVFFNDLNLRHPNKIIRNNFASLSEQLATTFIEVEKYINEFKPDKILVLGDTNSGLSAIICERLGIPVYHMEAGNRCYDLKVPEEKNRKLIDSISTINLPYTQLSRENLLREGISNNRIYVTGNPIKEVIEFYKEQILNSKICEKLNLEPKKYVIVTAHRAENVDNAERLKNILDSLQEISKDYTVIFSCHPRTKEKIKKFNLEISNEKIKILAPLGFFDFVNLELNSAMAITDSGTVQEEMCLFNIPTVTIRDTTERPETVSCGSNIISGLQKENIILCYNKMKQHNLFWDIPTEYQKTNVSDIVINILLSNRETNNV